MAAVLLALIAIVAAAQEPVRDAQRFEVISIKPSTELSSRGGAPESPDRFVSPNSTLAELIRFAYDLQWYQVVGGEAWTRSTRFDVEGRAARVPSRAEMRVMVRSLLEDRFGLRVIREVREMPVFELTQASREPGPNLKPADDRCIAAAAEPAAKTPPECRTLMQGKPGPNGLLLSYRTAASSMSEFATWLAPNTGRPVIDRTGLTGRFSATLSFAPGNTPTTDAAIDAPPTVFTAVREQLGLMLKGGSGSVDVVVIQSAHPPTAN